MTTIVLKDGVLAADTLCVAGGIRETGTFVKVERTHVGLVATTGTLTFNRAFREWVRNGRKGKPPSFCANDEINNSGIIVHPDGTVHVYNEDGYTEFPPGSYEYLAWGSGWELALGALAHDPKCTAEQAVRAAMKHDTRSGGDVTVLRLGGANGARGRRRHR